MTNNIFIKQEEWVGIVNPVAVFSQSRASASMEVTALPVPSWRKPAWIPIRNQANNDECEEAPLSVPVSSCHQQGHSCAYVGCCAVYPEKHLTGVLDPLKKAHARIIHLLFVVPFRGPPNEGSVTSGDDDCIHRRLPGTILVRMAGRGCSRQSRILKSYPWRQLGMRRVMRSILWVWFSSSSIADMMMGLFEIEGR